MILNIVVGGRATINGTIVQKTVASGATILAGDFVTFDASDRAAAYSGKIDGVARSSGTGGEQIYVYTPTAGT